MLSGDTTLAVGGDDEIKRTAERAACNPRER